MSKKITKLLALSDSEKITLIKAAKETLLQQISQERLFREFSQIYSEELRSNSLNSALAKPIHQRALVKPIMRGLLKNTQNILSFFK